MSLGFFRRRQKMVIIIMVILMGSFLVGSYGVNMLFKQGPGEHVLVRLNDGREFTQTDLQRARSDLELLGRPPIALGQGQGLQDSAFVIIQRASGNQAFLQYALLTHEAADKDVKVSEAEIDMFFARRGLVEDGYRSFLSMLREEQRIPESIVRKIVARWLRVFKLAMASLPQVPPSEEQLQRVFRDQMEQLELRVALIPRATFLSNVPEPNAAQINEHFQTYRSVLPGRYPGPDSFGFGYAQPARIGLNYLHINGEAIARVVRPSDQQMHDYYLANQDQLTAPTDDPNAPPRKLSFTEAKERIQRQMIPQLVEQSAATVADQVSRLLVEYQRLDPTPEVGPFEWVARQLQGPADSLLDKPVTLRVIEKPLDQAIDTLARATGLQAICYPWGSHRGQSLDPGIKVTIDADQVPLRDVLAGLGRDIDWVELSWATCPAFPKTIFPVEGVKMLPVSADQLPPTPLEDIAAHPLLGRASYNQRTLPQMVAQLAQRELERRQQADPNDAPDSAVLDTRMEMNLPGTLGGKLYWSLSSVDPAQPAGEITPPLRRQIVADWKQVQAQQRAVQAGNEIRNATLFDSAVEKLDLQPAETEPITRTRGDLDLLGLPEGANAQVRKFLQAAFELTPEDPNGRYPEASDEVRSVSLPAAGNVAVVQRIGYTPASLAEYQAIRPRVAAQLTMDSLGRAMNVYFHPEVIRRRVGGYEATLDR